MVVRQGEEVVAMAGAALRRLGLTDTDPVVVLLAACCAAAIPCCSR